MSILTRRRLLQMSGVAVATLASPQGLRLARAHSDVPVALRATTRTLEVNGKAAKVLGIMQANGDMGLSGLRGEHFRAELRNELDRETLIHWHGLTPPSEQDGVPVLSQPALQPDGLYAYDFHHNRAGTHWMHSHVGLQEQELLAAPLIVRTPEDLQADEQEVVVLLHDFSFRAPEEIFHELRQAPAMDMSMGADDDHAMESEGDGQGMAMDHQETEPAMQMEGMEMDHGQDEAMGADMGEDMGGGGHGEMVHFNDVDFDAYLANDRSLADPEVVRVEPGGRLRLRIINAAAATNFLIDLGTLEGDLIAVDGNDIHPIRGKQFDFAIAQRMDIRLTLPAGQGAYPLLALREDGHERTGIVLATKNAKVEKVAAMGHDKTRPLDLMLEHRLSASKRPPERAATRRHLVELTGAHAGYQWALNEKTFDPDDPLWVTEGDRVEMVLRNKTAMPHPIHLHGHHFQVVAIDGARFAGALRDTVLVPPKREVTIAFDADNPGHWAFHCHQLYHMAAGMMTSVRYEGYQRA